VDDEDDLNPPKDFEFEAKIQNNRLDSPNLPLPKYTESLFVKKAIA
jgi:hypothetical protein